MSVLPDSLPKMMRSKLRSFIIVMDIIFVSFLTIVAEGLKSNYKIAVGRSKRRKVLILTEMVGICCERGSILLEGDHKTYSAQSVTVLFMISLATHIFALVMKYMTMECPILLREN